MPATVEDRQRRELDFWRNSLTDRPGSDSIDTILSKAGDANVFVSLLRRYKDLVPKSGRVLELGAGNGWASSIFKRLYPGAEVTTTDISEEALQSIHRWPPVFGGTPDRSYACLAYQTREADSSVDFAFCFAAAHHFIEHEKVQQELARILRPGGLAAFFYEPSSPTFWYRPMYWRVNRNRPEVPEDVLVPSRMTAAARAAGLQPRIDMYPSTAKRHPFETVYFAALGAVPVLQHLLPCTANFFFHRLASTRT